MPLPWPTYSDNRRRVIWVLGEGCFRTLGLLRPRGSSLSHFDRLSYPSLGSAFPDRVVSEGAVCVPSALVCVCEGVGARRLGARRHAYAVAQQHPAPWKIRKENRRCIAARKAKSSMREEKSEARPVPAPSRATFSCGSTANWLRYDSRWRRCWIAFHQSLRYSENRIKASSNASSGSFVTRYT